MIRLATLLLLVAGLCTGHPAVADETPAQKKCVPGTGIEMSSTGDAPWTVQLQLSPDDVPLNAPFAAKVTICSQLNQYPAKLAMDATMPAHKHGMNYQPSMEKIDDNHYSVNNILFHMPGIWRFEVTAYGKDKTHRYTYEVNVK